MESPISRAMALVIAGGGHGAWEHFVAARRRRRHGTVAWRITGVGAAPPITESSWVGGQGAKWAKGTDNDVGWGGSGGRGRGRQFRVSEGAGKRA